MGKIHCMWGPHENPSRDAGLGVTSLLVTSLRISCCEEFYRHILYIIICKGIDINIHKKHKIPKSAATEGLLVYYLNTWGYRRLSHTARLVAQWNSSTRVDCCFSLLQEFHPPASRPCWSWREANTGMIRAINGLSIKGRRAVVGFNSVSSRKWDQTYSQTARPATASLGGQEISSDPPFYDPQLSASEKHRGLEVGQGERKAKWPKNVTSLGRTWGNSTTGRSCDWI